MIRLSHFTAWLVAAAALAAGGIAAADEVDGLTLPVHSVIVSAPVQDLIAEVLVEEGDPVKEGQPLARLRDEKERIAMERYQTMLEKKEFDHQAADNLLKQNIMSKERALEAKSELALARVDLALAEVQLAEKTITSPISGIVVRRLIEVGESVDHIEPVFEIVNIDQLHLQFFLEPRYLKSLKKGDPVPFRVEGQDQPGDPPRSSVVDFISPAADPGSGLFRVKLLVENPDHAIKAGLRVRAEFSEK